MSNKTIIEKNVAKLTCFEITRLTNETSFREVEGEIISFLHLLLDPNSGAILDLTRKVCFDEKAVSIPIAVKRKSLLDIKEKPLLDLVDKETSISLEAYRVLQESLLAFNRKNSSVIG
jgi:hypothetical protein